MAEHSKRTSEQTAGLEVTDCSLWRTQHRLSEGRPDQPTEAESGDSSRLDVSDSSLWRTRVASNEASSLPTDTPTEEASSETEKETADSNTTVTAESEENDDERDKTTTEEGEQTPPPFHSFEEPAGERRSSQQTEGMEITDCSLWRTRVGAQTDASMSAAESSRLEVSDNSLWRTRVGRPSEEAVEQPPVRHSSGLELTDCSLWRTRVRLSELQLEEQEEQEEREEQEEVEMPTESSRLDLSDNSLWRTNIAAAENEAEELPHTTTKLVDFTADEADESTVGSLPPSAGRPPVQKTRVSMRLSSLQPVVEESETSAPPTFVGLQSPVDVTMRTADSELTPRRSSVSRPLGYAESTVASRARSVDRSAANTPDGSPACSRHAHGRQPRESVEVFTQTSGNEAQLLAERRRTANPLTQNFRPLSPRRRATLMQPPRMPNARPSVWAPFFSRFSSGSEQSSRQSVESSDRSLTRSPATRIPAPLRLPSTPAGSPRLADRVRMNEALKMVGVSPQSARSRLPTRSPATPPAAAVAERPTRSGDALRRLCDDYTTPERTPQAARPGVFQFSIDATPPSRRAADSLFETSGETPKSGRIASQPLRLPAGHCALPWNEDIAGSLFDSATDPPPVASQPIGSQVPQRPPFRLLNDDDFCTSTPPPRRSRPPAAVFVESPVAQPVVALPESLRCGDDTPLGVSFDFSRAADQTAGQSFAAGGSDCDSDVGSPAPKHIVLRAPRHNMVGSENDNPNPALRRSSRTRLTRACDRGLGERPVYQRDADGNFRLVGVQEGRTADPLCKKWGTFDKDKAIQLDRDASKRRRAVRLQNKRKWERDFAPLPADGDDDDE